MGSLIQEISGSIKPTKRDKCILPVSLSEELAEEFGIHTGDGHLSFRKYGVNTVYEYGVSSSGDELDYVLGFIKPLIKKLYSLEVKLYKDKRSNTISFQYKSKSLLIFKKKLGFPLGKKDSIEIPKVILESPFITDFIRGYFDTDGCLQFKNRNKKAAPYPVLDMGGKSKKLVTQINDFLLSVGFTTSLVQSSCLHYETKVICPRTRIFIYGKKNLKKWVELIGFSNPKNINKFEEWKNNHSINL
ncbi:MAG: hypothetical protein JW703_04630 [Candidatus Diapherotrites archaeon]|nr:hypothetical protein [Candidatus Diapherotrites archaeon]